MLIRDQHWPSTDGFVVTTLRNGLTDWSSGLSVARKRPVTMTRRVVTVRNDGGSAVGRMLLRRYGINLWCDSVLAGQQGDPAKDAELMAIDCITALSPHAVPDSFTDAVEIEDEPPFLVGGKSLAHYYFTFQLPVKALQN